MSQNDCSRDWRKGPGIENFYRYRLERLKTNTVNMYGVYLKEFIVYCCEEFDCTPEELDFARCYKRMLRDRIIEFPLPPQVVDKFISTLPASEQINGRSCINIYLNFLVRTRKLTHNPMREVEPISRKKPPKRSLPVSDVLCLVQEIQGEPLWMKASLLTQLSTGMRVSELIHLRINDIEFTETGLIAYIRRSSTKNHKAYAIPVPNIQPLIHEYLKWRGTLDNTASNFFLDQGGNPLTVSLVNRALQRLGEAAGCRRVVTSHDLRRGYAAILTHVLGTTETTRQLMRQKHDSTTNGYTAIPTTEEVRDALGNIPSVMLAEKLARVWLRNKYVR